MPIIKRGHCCVDHILLAKWISIKIGITLFEYTEIFIGVHIFKGRAFRYCLK